MKIALVAAVARNGVIGGDGALPWRISDDLKWFKKNTLGKPLLMGRKTFHSIGKALPGRDNIVLTRDPSFSAPGVFIARSLRGAIALGTTCARARGAEEICVIGGGDIYAQTIARADRLTRDGERLGEAIDLLEGALQRDDLSPRERAAALLTLGTALNAARRPRDAAERFVQLAREHPTDPEAARAIENAASIANELHQQYPQFY